MSLCAFLFFWQNETEPCCQLSIADLRKNHANMGLSMIVGDVELVAKLEDELKHEKASGLEDLESSVQNIQYVLQNNSWEVRSSLDIH